MVPGCTNTLLQLQGFIECCEKNQYSLQFFFEITEKNVFFPLNLITIGTGDKTMPANNYLFKVNNRYVEYVQSLLWRYQNGVNDKKRKLLAGIPQETWCSHAGNIYPYNNNIPYIENNVFLHELFILCS